MSEVEKEAIITNREVPKFTIADILEKKNVLSRVLIVANGQKVGRGDGTPMYEGLFDLRPIWSNISPTKVAIPGGKIKREDFEGILDENDINNPAFALSPEQLDLVARKAACREVREELKIELSPESLAPSKPLFFTNESPPGSLWHTFAYTVVLPDKPEVVVKPESAGTLWLPILKLIDPENSKDEHFLSEHFGIAQALIYWLREESEEQ